MFLKIKRPLSLSLQLSLWYTSVSFLLLLLGSGWMYLQLVRAYDASEADFLLRKALTLKELARQQDLPILKWEIAGSYLDGRTRPRAGAAPSAPFALTLSRVLSPDGSIMIETDRMSEQIPMQSFPLEGPLNGTYRGRLFRMLAMTSAEGFRIQVARDYTLQENIVASYRRKLWSFLGIGLLLSAQAGFMIARHGMRPVEGIAGTLQRIGSSTLGERVKTEGLPAELSLLASTFNKTLDRLEDAFARMASFSSDIAHELRTPIGNLRGESEVALSRARTVEEYRDILESSLEEYLRLSQIIDRLLFLARAENPATEIHREPVDVGMELQKVCEFYEAAASDASIGLDIVTPPSFIVGVDRTLLQRALSNLIENSLAHTSAGGHIRLEAVRSNGSLLISVADDGCGIATEHLTRVFDRFYRIDRARSQNNGGAGLGLAIVKSVASMHGGEAGIDSTVGKGTRVTLRLPVA
jgi:two-component system, OmpR family, heavy metal sensor histidine kinase CusS